MFYHNVYTTRRCLWGCHPVFLFSQVSLSPCRCSHSLSVRFRSLPTVLLLFMVTLSFLIVPVKRTHPAPFGTGMNQKRLYDNLLSCRYISLWLAGCRNIHQPSFPKTKPQHRGDNPMNPTLELFKATILPHCKAHNTTTFCPNDVKHLVQHQRVQGFYLRGYTKKIRRVRPRGCLVDQWMYEIDGKFVDWQLINHV